MSDAISTPAPEGESLQRDFQAMRRFLRFCGWSSLLFVIVFLFGGVWPPMSSIRYAWANAQMQQARMLGQMLFAYATDHDGKYPDGNSSTEIFQKLLDENYAIDPMSFYVPMVGKTEPITGQKLKPENVCWDVTCCADSSSSDLLPLVFLTGYKVTYAPGGTAVSIIKPYPPFTRTWGQWWNGSSGPDQNKGIAVFYKGNDAVFLRLDGHVNPDGTDVKNPDGVIPNFVSPQFDSKGVTYRQLTPNGPLP